jgi:hypothetical protein
MARRVATDYKRLHLEIRSEQLQDLINWFVTHFASSEVRVFDNGDTELMLCDDDVYIPLIFRPFGSHYLFEGSFCTKDLTLANALRKAIQAYKGHAVVHRIYPTYVVVYTYEYGTVTRIEEVKDKEVRLVYENKNTLNRLRRMLADDRLETYLEWVKWQIDWLLDQRLKGEHVQAIDQKLAELARELIALEG